MDMTIFAPRLTHALLTWLGKRKWLNLIVGGNYTTHIKLNVKESDIPREYLSEYRLLIKTANKDNRNAIYFFSVSGLLAEGPKVFCPNAEQCESLRHVKADIPISYYQQPYKNFIIEFPSEYLRSLSEEFKLEMKYIPRHVILTHEQNTLIVSAKLYNCEYVCMMSDRPEFNVIEDALIRNVDIGEEYIQREIPAVLILQRLAVNFACLMTYTGITKPEPSPRRVKLSTRSDERSKLLLLGEPYYFGLQQKIVVREVDENKSVGEGPSPSPHWRKGHWKMVPCGILRRERKLVFIRPVFVLASKFQGDLSNTSAEYRIKK